MRKPVIAGNWKMHKTTDDTYQFMQRLVYEVNKINGAVDVIVCPAFTSLETALQATKESDVKVAAQNMHFEESGAFTGEVSPIMLKEIGIDYCIIGHSERRQYFGETDQDINKKIKAAFNHGIVPILCVGESLLEREEGNAFTVIEKQIKIALEGVEASQVSEMIIAYEPIWAIGTGKTASATDAQEIIAKIREIIAATSGDDTAAKVRIQYGGSVKPENIKDFMGQEDIDGALVGGASLEIESFLKLVNY